jgi:hypothetical protein
MSQVPPVRHRLADAAFHELAKRQELVVSRRQLAEFGVTRQVISRRETAGHWIAVGPLVVVLRPGGLTRPQQLWAGVLHAGGDACLARLTGLEAAGLTGFRDDDVHVCRTHGENTDDLVHELVQVRVHESRNLPPPDLLRTSSPPRMSQDRCAADAASDARSERACRTILAMCVQQRLIVPGRLRAMVVERHNLPRRKLILETLGDLEGGAHSLPEQDFLRSLRRARVPLPVRQRIVRRSDGRYVLDCDYDDWLVTVEINGSQHFDVRQKEYDDIRRTRLAIGGRLVVDLGSWIVRHDGDLAVLITADALLARGWRPAPDVRARLLDMARDHATFSWSSTAA